MLIRIFTVFITLAALLACVPGWGDQPFRPRTVAELGYVDSQPAYKLTKATLAWANYTALRRDFRELQSLSDSQIDEWILRNFAYISRNQLLHEGVRNWPMAADTSQTKTAYHPLDYNRASLLEADTGGLVDVKGSGLGLDEIMNSVEWLRIYQQLLGREEVTHEDLDRLNKEADRLKRTVESDKTILDARKRKSLLQLPPSERRYVTEDLVATYGSLEDAIAAISHSYHYNSKKLAEISAIAKVFDRALSGSTGRVPGNGVDLLNLIWNKDHSDGLMSFAESIAEVTRQQTASALFDLHYRNGNELRARAIDSYFIIDTGFDIIGSNASPIPAAILGRQAHWSDHHKPGAWVPDGTLRDPHGFRQRDFLGAMVDFGAVEIVEPSVHAKFRINHGKKGSANYYEAWKLAQEPVRDFRNGTPSAVSAHIRAMTEQLSGRLARAPDKGPAEVERLLQDAFNAVSDPTTAPELVRSHLAKVSALAKGRSAPMKKGNLHLVLMLRLALTHPGIAEEVLKPAIAQASRENIDFIVETLIPSLVNQPRLLRKALQGYRGRAKIRRERLVFAYLMASTDEARKIIRETYQSMPTKTNPVVSIDQVAQDYVGPRAHIERIFDLPAQKAAAVSTSPSSEKPASFWQWCQRLLLPRRV